MTGALIILAVTAAIGLLLWLLDRKSDSNDPVGTSLRDVNPSQTPGSDPSDPSAPHAAPDQCCGRHLVCEKLSLSPQDTEIEYFDDEELDAFKGREPDSYSEAETDMFRDVLLTLPVGEVAAWARSIQLRGISLPSPVRDELLLIVADERDKNL